MWYLKVSRRILVSKLVSRDFVIFFPRNYDVLLSDGMPDVVRKCVEFLQSEAVFLILSNLTGLRLHRLAPRTQNIDDADDDEVLTAEEDFDAASATASGSNIAVSCFNTDPVDDDSSQNSEQAVSSKRRRIASPSSCTAFNDDKRNDEGWFN